jgi:hypothetical protein
LPESAEAFCSRGNGVEMAQPVSSDMTETATAKRPKFDLPFRTAKLNFSNMIERSSESKKD